MSKFMYKALNHVRSTIGNFYLIRIQPYSTSLRSINSPSPHSFTTSYLINSCGFSLEKALSASSYLKLEASKNPDSVLAFLKSQGFNQAQILRIVRTNPPVLLSNPEKTLLPKLQFFRSKGMPSSEVAKLLTAAPVLFRRSLKEHIIPFVALLNNLLQSEEKTLVALMNSGRLLLCDPKALLIPNIESLKEAGVPSKHIATFLMQQPQMFRTSSKRIREVSEEVKKMGFNPSTITFLLAVHVMSSMSKSTWEKKLNVYKKWGWSREDTLAAYRRSPWCMAVSEDKIMSVMDYLVNKMGQDSSSIRRRPRIIEYCLERRIIPRCALYEILLSKGLIKKSDSSLLSMLMLTEERFLKLLNSYKEEAPELLKLYKAKRAPAK